MSGGAFSETPTGAFRTPDALSRASERRSCRSRRLQPLRRRVSAAQESERRGWLGGLGGGRWWLAGCSRRWFRLGQGFERREAERTGGRAVRQVDATLRAVVE